MLAQAGGTQQVAVEAKPAMERARPSIVTFEARGLGQGLAVMIDAKGYFLAHRHGQTGNFAAQTLAGQSFQLKWIAEDEPSQLILLQAAGPLPPGVRPIRVVSPEALTQGKGLIVATAREAFRAEFVSSDRLGILNPSRRLLPLSEVQFQRQKPVNFGGALLLTEAGELAGILHAVLDPRQQQLRGGLLKGVAETAPGLQVGFSIDAAGLEHVIRGLLSPSHEVLRPSIGALCKDAEAENGALVVEVVPGSPAAEAGLRKGDVICELGGYTVHNQIDFARAMLRQPIGKTIDITILRDRVFKVLAIKIGKACD